MADTWRPHAGRVGRWAGAAALLAAVTVAAQLAVDLGSRSVTVSLVPARIAAELGGLATVLLAAALVAALVDPGRVRGDLATRLLGGALALSGVEMVLRARGGTYSPGDRFTVAVLVLLLGVAIAAAAATCRRQPPLALLTRTAELAAGGSLAWLALRSAVAPTGTVDVRAAQGRWLGLTATISCAALVVLAVRQRHLVARTVAALAVVAAATVVASTSSPSRATWVVAAVAVAALRLWPAGLLAAPVAAARRRRRSSGRTPSGAPRTSPSPTARLRPVLGAVRAGIRRATSPIRRASRAVLVPEGPDGASRAVAARPGDRWWAAGLLAIITVTVAVDVISALRLGAHPTGDGAKVVARSIDVGTSRTPLLGMPTSFADGTTTIAAHHPGPMLFEVLAPFVRLLGFRAGAFVGAALLSWGAWTLAVWAAFRAGGRAAALGALVGGAVVGNVIIRNLAFEPNNIYTPFQPLFALPLLCWAAATGTRRALPWAVLLASLSMQAYLAHTILVGLPLAWAAAVLWHERRRTPENRRSLLLALAVALVCWAPPLWEAAANRGGNLRALAVAAFADTGTLGPSGLLRAPAWALQVPVPWGRLDRAFGPDSSTYLGPISWVGLLVLLVTVLAAVAQRDVASTAQRRLWVTGGLFLLGGGITASQLRDGPTPSYTVLWLGALSVFVWFVAVMTIGSFAREALARHHVAAPARARQVAFGAVALLVLAQGLRTSTLDQIRGSYGFIDLAAPELLDAARAGIEPDDRVFVVGLDGQAAQIAGEALATPLITAGQDVTITPDSREYYGDFRVPGPGWTGTALLVTDDLAPQPPQGTRLAHVEPPGWDRAAYERSAAEVADWARAHGPIRLSSADPRGLAIALARWYPATGCDELARQVGREADPADLPDGALARLYVEHQVVSPRLPAELQAEVDSTLLATPLELWRSEVREPFTTPIPEAAFSPCAPVP